MNILVSGSSGLIGSALVASLSAEGHTVTRLVRFFRHSEEREITWNPLAGAIDIAALEGIEAVVHLAGESIANGRWTIARQAAIRDSRVNGTRLLSESLMRLSRPPRVLISASGVGYYGDRANETLSEESPMGKGFFANLCRDWEAATAPAQARGIRVVHARMGIVLSPSGGALAKMLAPFKLGLGGRFGSGRQYLSWVSIEDVIGAISHALMSEHLRGPVNVVAPQTLTNAEFTRTLGRVILRPTLVSVPRLALRLFFGKLAEEAILASARVVPSQLIATHYKFQYPDLEGALRHALGRP
jgi:uncharacterized protein (TIGR01777 family)